MMPINKRKRNVPKASVRPEPILVAVPEAEVVAKLIPKPVIGLLHPLLTKSADALLPHEARKLELYYEHNKEIPLEEIFVDKGNGVILYRTVRGGWVSSPDFRGGDIYE